MASTADFVAYVCEQLAAAGEISARKMFGEYGLYCDGKFFGLICDNQLFVKPTEAGRALSPACPLAPPYAEAKPHLLIEDLESRPLLTELLLVTCAELPLPKPRKKKQP